MKQKQSWFERHPAWTGIIITIVVLYLYDTWKEKNCDLEFEKYTEINCGTACDGKCLDEGFSSYKSSVSYQSDYGLGVWKRCVCKCGGCRK